jgi:hypothetical protein
MSVGTDPSLLTSLGKTELVAGDDDNLSLIHEDMSDDDDNLSLIHEAISLSAEYAELNELSSKLEDNVKLTSSVLRLLVASKADWSTPDERDVMIGLLEDISTAKSDWPNSDESDIIIGLLDVSSTTD